MFSRETFYIVIVLCLNILWLKAVSEITARQTLTSLRKHDVIKVCSIEYLATQIELLLPTFKSWTVHKIIEYVTLGLLSSLWNIYHSTTAYFFGPPCKSAMEWRCSAYEGVLIALSGRCALALNESARGRDPAARFADKRSS